MSLGTAPNTCAESAAEQVAGIPAHLVWCSAFLQFPPYVVVKYLRLAEVPEFAEVVPAHSEQRLRVTVRSRLFPRWVVGGLVSFDCTSYEPVYGYLVVSSIGVPLASIPNAPAPLKTTLSGEPGPTVQLPLARPPIRSCAPDAMVCWSASRALKTHPITPSALWRLSSNFHHATRAVRRTLASGNPWTEAKDSAFSRPAAVFKAANALYEFRPNILRVLSLLEFPHCPAGLHQLFLRGHSLPPWNQHRSIKPSQWRPTSAWRQRPWQVVSGAGAFPPRYLGIREPSFLPVS